MSSNTISFMSLQDLRQAQKIMLYIMKRIHEVCVEHNIKYWLDYGTLLGAVRHDGFIPWDDDMDISMMREDYEKFCKIAPDVLGEEFFWQTRHTDPLFFNEYGRVRLDGTVWMQQRWQNVALKNHGLFVDIFPIDPFPTNRHKIKSLMFIRILLLGIADAHLYGIYSPSLFKSSIQKFFALIISKKKIADLYDKFIKYLRKYGKDSNMVSTISMDTEQNLCDKHIFDELALKKFEDTEFFIPARYDERLRGKFGNYMQLPPEDQRYGHHGIIKIDFGKYKNLK